MGRAHLLQLAHARQPTAQQAQHHLPLVDSPDPPAILTPPLIGRTHQSASSSGKTSQHRRSCYGRTPRRPLPHANLLAYKYLDFHAPPPSPTLTLNPQPPPRFHLADSTVPPPRSKPAPASNRSYTMHSPTSTTPASRSAHLGTAPGTHPLSLPP